MIKAKELKDIKKPNLNNYSDGYAKILCNEGLCSIESNVEIVGIQLEFLGNAEITPKLPESWIMQGKNNKILMFSLNNIPIQNVDLFEYIGQVKIVKHIVVDKNVKKVKTDIVKTKVDWKSSYWDWGVETTDLDEFKNKRKVGFSTKTKYNLPDYGLPKVDKTKIKKTKRRKPTSTSGGSSGGY